MTQIEYMDKLKFYLNQANEKLSESEKFDILRDYEEYFREGKLEGKTEFEICESLGDPKYIVEEMIDMDSFTSSSFKDNSNEKIEYSSDIKADFNEYKKKIDEFNRSQWAKGLDDVGKKTFNIIKFLVFIFVFFMFTFIYFPTVIFCLLSLIVIALFFLLPIPFCSTLLAEIGMNPAMGIFPVVGILGFVVVACFALYYLVKIGIIVDKKIIYVYKNI